MESTKKFIDSKIIIGVILILIGKMILLKNMGLITDKLYDIILSWQTFVIFVGLLILVQAKNKIPGIVFVFIGIGFLLPKFFDIHYEFSQVFWPIVLISIGLLVLFKKKSYEKFDDFHAHIHAKFAEHCNESRHNCCGNNSFSKAENNSPDFLNDFNFFSGTERRITTQNFKGGKVTNVFGGGNYDFLSAEMAEGDNYFEVTNIFGGVKIIAPSNWKIQFDVISIFGGFADKRRNVPEVNLNAGKILHIKGISFFGGGEIR